MAGRAVFDPHKARTIIMHTRQMRIFAFAGYFWEKTFPSDDVTIRNYVLGYDGEGNIVHQEYISNYAGVSWG